MLLNAPTRNYSCTDLFILCFFPASWADLTNQMRLCTPPLGAALRRSALLSMHVSMSLYSTAMVLSTAVTSHPRPLPLTLPNRRLGRDTALRLTLCTLAHCTKPHMHPLAHPLLCHAARRRSSLSPCLCAPHPGMSRARLLNLSRVPRSSVRPSGLCRGTCVHVILRDCQQLYRLK